MKKRVVISVLITLILISIFPIVFAADDDPADPLEKAYNCLEDKVQDRCDELTVEEQAFVLLAMPHISSIKSDCKDALIDNSKNNGECWPENSCKLRETALAILALERINADTDDAVEWLLEQNTTSDDLEWFIQTDIINREAASCRVKYDSRSFDFNIKDDDKLSGSVGNCLGISSSGYWLQISSSCLDKEFTVSCDKDFITTLVYMKNQGETIYISEKTHQGSPNSETKEKVKSFCFAQGGRCNYEGSLWATLALNKEDEEIDDFLPYLVALAEDNEEFFPDTFLYMLTIQDEYFSNILDLQQLGKYWRVGSKYNELYDSALALLALYDDSVNEKESAKQYLFNERQSGVDGCFGGIRDTAFLLFALDQKPSGGTPPVPEDEDCEEAGYFCEDRLECISQDIGGKVYTNYACPGIKVCCSVQVPEETCAEKGGEICLSGKRCDGLEVSAFDVTAGVCCKGICVENVVEPECETEGFTCRDFCLNDEEEEIYDCNNDQICCVYVEPPEPTSYWWLWVFAILIILVILAIVFKDRLRMFIHNMKNKLSKGKGSKSDGRGMPPRPGRPFPPGMRRPGMRPLPPGQGMRRPGIRPFPQGAIRPGMHPLPPGARPGMRRPVIKKTEPLRKEEKKIPKTKSDKEVDDTLKKLKEMSEKKK